MPLESALTCLGTAMICSSVNRFLFISPSFDQGPDSNLRWRKNSAAGQRPPLAGRRSDQSTVPLTGSRITLSFSGITYEGRHCKVGGSVANSKLRRGKASAQFLRGQDFKLFDK